MALPKLSLLNYELPKDSLLLDIIMRKLNAMGYWCEDEHDIIKYIEQYHLDTSQFEFPDGDYDTFKKNLMAGKYDVEIHFMTDEYREQSKRDVESGKIWVTY